MPPGASSEEHGGGEYEEGGKEERGNWMGREGSQRWGRTGLGRQEGRGRSSGKRRGCSLGTRETLRVSRLDTEKTLSSPGWLETSLVVDITSSALLRLHTQL